MSWQATKFVQDDERIKTPSELSVMMAIANNADEEGKAWPGVKLIARRARLTQRRTQQILRILEERGVVWVGRKASQWGTNLYKIKGME